MNPQWKPIDTVPQEIKDSRQDIFMSYVCPVYGPQYSIGFWHIIGDYGYWKSPSCSGPTHWMPIPPLTIE